MSDITAVDSQLHQLTQGVSVCDDTPLFFINAQGEWFYQQGLLPDKFSRLFSSILQRLEGDYFLITPVEKVRVEVEAYPLLIVDFQEIGSGQLQVTTSLDTQFMLDSRHCFEIQAQDIFVLLPKGLSAKLGRACYYRFIEQFLVDDTELG
ncbi:DUF1285 domain-containing protein [Shewanella algidipiscicola]|uniref:DUF1285 domain-containing protein n=1 Tax=Shewanella algidipiscicola TaxID=614070 RepID=A0ABQ4PMS3_9GAMM|nr:DUF1285 domain-containing protein [Shewanella algidipiscicola]GIU49615.1 DUF1285 domain-containing protein [Shewanella algidipiscicola]